MSDERFRPNRVNSNNTSQRMPIQRKQEVPNRLESNNYKVRPTLNRTIEPERRLERPQRQTFDNNYNEPQKTTRTFAPQEQEVDGNDFIPTQNEKKKNKKWLFLLFGIVFLLCLIVGGLKLISTYSNGTKGIDSSSVLSGNKDILNQNKITNGSGSILGETNSNNVSYNGDLIPVKWPSDITPTKMEIQLDPTTGDPILILIGDKTGLGTVIRSYNKSGNLTGFWVIVPDSSLSTDSNTNTTNKTSEKNNKEVDTTNTVTETNTNTDTNANSGTGTDSNTSNETNSTGINLPSIGLGTGTGQ